MLRKIRFIIIFLVVAIFNVFAANAQDAASIEVMARPAGDSIVLRWAPTSPVAWRLLNEYGYRIERYTISRDSHVLESKTKIDLTVNAIRPAEQSAWMSKIDRDDFVAICAQAIFGESFEMKSGSSTDIFQVYHKSKELESRYSFALFAADVSSQAANLSGLRFVDKTVDKREKYLYRVYSLVPPEKAEINFGSIYTGLLDYISLPKPPAPLLKFSDKSVMLSWVTTNQQITYTAYYVERSLDGNSFSRINSMPIVALDEGKEPQQLTASFTDSLVSKDDTIYYRITGLTPFGETGPLSNASSGKALIKLARQLSNFKTSLLQTGKILLTWEFPKESEYTVRNFLIDRSKHANDGFEPISESLSNGKREYIDEKPLAVNYYRITVIGNSGEKMQSFPVMIQLEDSIPPLPPGKLQATIDTIGIVKLNWKPNKEGDLLGYRVFRSNFKNSEFSQITGSPVTDTVYIDTVNIKTLSEKVYYKLLAVDTRHNPSEFSAIVKLKRPDRIAPAPSPINKYEAVNNSLFISWDLSSSADVRTYTLLAKRKQEDMWHRIAILPTDEIQQYTMTSLDRATYSLQIVTTDSSGNSSSSPVLDVVITAREQKPAVENIKASIDRQDKTITLNWKYESSGVRKYIIYRNNGTDTPVSIYGSVGGTVNEFIDKELQMNSVYTYYFKATFEDGSESKFSKEIIVSY